MHNERKIIIVDYGMGNLFSVRHACEHLGQQALISSDKKDLMQADAIILPGVGAFGDAMDNLQKLDLVTALKDQINQGKSFLGICLGMQLLLSESEEFGNHAGLSIIKGVVKKFPNIKYKVPQVGWNQIKGDWTDTLLQGVPQGSYMYFVHSFYATPESQEVVSSSTNYAGIDYCSSISKDNIFASQFHPERSGPIGLHILKNFINNI